MESILRRGRIKRSITRRRTRTRSVISFVIVSDLELKLLLDPISSGHSGEGDVFHYFYLREEAGAKIGQGEQPREEGG